MRVSLLQIASRDDESPQARLRRVSRAVLAEPDLRESDLLVLPELWTMGYFAFDAYENGAEALDGTTVSAAREWATEFRLHVHLGSFVERDERGLLHNTSVVLGPDARIRAVYRKVHLFGYGSRESQLLTSGADVTVSEIGGVPTGITTCYDLRFPELFRSMVDTGAEQFAVCAAWPAARLAHWRLFTEVRAVEQQAYLIAANAVGTQHGVELGGHSRVVDPTGEVLAEAGRDEGFTHVDLDPGLPRRVRAEFPALADRRWTGRPAEEVLA
ncbi:carbon-nitrogen family hydrolase [Amycolatopsis granulosa]|uniref:carbon-nitrogen family hydrolase n=1 Tax=Amycolatopsis granulosa TaxID=185684 RepID=UPI00141E06E1|nr:carbon-nitrogen family hydrolase [Amycolatopsis granulosa]NIH86585.1 putative amidohydrolase [Amycolatopsis granulosa]